MGDLIRENKRSTDSGINRTDKAHAMSVRPHNRCHHKGKLIDYISCRYYNTMYNTTYSDVSFGRFTNALSLTNDIGLFLRDLKYSFTLESSIRIDIPELSNPEHCVL